MNIDITKEKYDEVSNTYPPNKFILFVYKYFSTETEKKDLKPHNTIMWTLGSLFGVSFIGSFFNLPRFFLLFTNLSFYFLLVIFVLTLFTAIKMNSYRVKKIYTKLGITIEQYNYLTNLYYPSKKI